MTDDTQFDDAARLRRRQQLAEDDAGALAGLESRPGCVVAKVSSGSAASGFWTVEAQLVTGTEADGSPGALTGTGVRFEALNLGATAPPAGTAVICHRVSYRWVFLYG